MDGSERVFKHDPLTRLLAAVTQSKKTFRKRKLRFLLDTDRNIENETRVGLTPDHIRRLISSLKECGIELQVSVAQAAGIWAGFRDRDFVEAGAEIVDWKKLSGLEQFDVVHALKEPVEHESEIQESFMRIGALHLASRSVGVGQMLSKKKFSALFDGSTVGSCSYLLSGAEETPIVASMSQLAGIIASERILKIGGERLRNERVLVIGAGYAGISAMLGLRDKVRSLTVVEKDARVRSQLAWLLRRLGFSEFAIVDKCSNELLRQATGIIFAHRTGADPAFKICSIDDIMLMEQGSVIVDIAVDQGGSIACPSIDPADDVYVRIGKYKEALKNYCYYAEPNMPRRKPREASKRHGDAVLPYIVALHLLCAEHGDPVSATGYLLSRKVQRLKERSELSLLHYEDDFFECVVQDLRNGLQVISENGELKICDPDIADNEEIVDFVSHPTRAELSS
jgi:alanine dehydrogenase